jgi:multidrug resistance protein, MATE family
MSAVDLPLKNLPACAAPSTAALLALAMPMIGMSLSRLLMGFIDFVMVSQLGTAAQAAVSPSAMLLFTVACVGMGISQGVQTFVSQAEGRGQPHLAGAYAWQALYIALAAAIVSAPVAFFTYAWFPLVAALGAHPPDVREMEVAFLSYALWSIGPMTACAALESFYNGIRRPKIGLAAVIASLITITVANWLLIFGNLGFPRMGIAGSGLATVLAWSVRMAVLLIPLTSRSIDERYVTRRGLAFSAAKMHEIVRLGWPVAFQWLVDIGAWLVFLLFMMPPFGKGALAGANLAIQYMHLSFMPAIGIGMALTTLVGNAAGARDPELAEAHVRVARRLVLGYMAVMGVVFLLVGGPLAGLMCFDENAADRVAVIEAARVMLIWVALFQVSDAICIVYSFASRGAGDTRSPAVLFAYCCWGIFICGGYATMWLLPGIGFHGPWAMCTLYIIVLGGLLWRRFNSREWMKLRVFTADASGPSG